MTIQDINKNIREGTIDPLLIFIDNNPYQTNELIHRVAKALNLPISYYSVLNDAISDASIILNDDSLYVVMLESKKIKKPAEVEELLSNLDIYGQNFIIVIQGKNVLSKKFDSHTYYIEKPSPNELCKIIAKACELNHIDMTQDAIIGLAQKSNGDLGVVINLLQQLKMLGKDKYSVEDLPTYDYREGNLFEFIDKIIAQDKGVWEYAQLIKDSPSIISYNLYAKAREKAINTSSEYYIHLMEVAETIFNGIIMGTIKDTYAIKYMLSII